MLITITVSVPSIVRIAANADTVAQYRAGRTQTLGFLVGLVMKRSGGRAEPKVVQQLLRRALEREPVPGAPE